MDGLYSYLFHMIIVLLNPMLKVVQVSALGAEAMLREFFSQHGCRTRYGRLWWECGTPFTRDLLASWKAATAAHGEKEEP